MRMSSPVPTAARAERLVIRPGSGGSTETRAGVLVTPPPVPVTTTVYVPASALVAAATAWLEPVAPAMGAPSLYH